MRSAAAALGEKQGRTDGREERAKPRGIGRHASVLSHYRIQSLSTDKRLSIDFVEVYSLDSYFSEHLRPLPDRQRSSKLYQII
jgi:hypothetical protein